MLCVLGLGLCVLCVLLFCGCSKLPRITTGATTVLGARDPGTPAKVDEDTTRTALSLPAGSEVRATRTEAAGDAPATTSWTIALPAAAELVSEARRIAASTGTVDTTVAVRRADNAARLPLLYAAIGAAVAAAGMLFLKYPTGAALCGGAAVVFFVAWQAAGLPAWFWAVGLAAIGVAAGLYFGFERGAGAADAAPKVEALK